MKTRKILAILLTIALMMGLLCTSAFATNQVVNLTYGSDITGLTLTCLEGYCTYSRTDENYVAWGNTNTRYTYNITVPPETLDSTVMTIQFTPASGTVVSTVPPAGPPQPFAQMIINNASNSYNVSLTNGTASLTVYVHRGLQASPAVYGRYDTYTFNLERGYPVSISTGDPVYIQWDTTNTHEGTVAHRGTATGWPDDFTLWVDNPGTVTQEYTPSGQTTPTSNTLTSIYHDGTNYAYTVPFQTVGSTVYAVSGNTTYTIHLDAKGNGTPSAAGASPTSVVSYLPIGQYATGSGWGSSSGKFATKTSLESTGVSLGALGGYIEFDFGEGGVRNDPRNPYGVDLVVYGNAFNGNPEAGSVQVGWVNNGTVTWYELAGSRYYDDNYTFVGNQGGTGKYSNAYSGTLCKTTVSYALGAEDIKVTLGSNGPYTFTTNTAWWPDKTEGSNAYADSVITAAHQSTYVTIARTGDSNGDTLTYGGVTAIQDSNVTADYAFGYADVTPNGTPSHYGDAVNPYTENDGTKTGGDGFDLEWAVDINTGLPADISDKVFRYVRVYTAVLDNGQFGETSTEVCGIFSAYRTDAENALSITTGVGRTTVPTALTFLITDPELGGTNPVPVSIPTNRGTVSAISAVSEAATTVAATTVDVSITAPSGAFVYVNGTMLSETGSSGTDGVYTGTILKPSSGQYLRVIVQEGTLAPYLFLIT